MARESPEAANFPNAIRVERNLPEGAVAAAGAEAGGVDSGAGTDKVRLLSETII